MAAQTTKCRVKNKKVSSATEDGAPRYEVISRGPTKSNKTDTCNALLEQFDKEKLAIQEHLDNMDVMLFKPREELLKDEAPRYSVQRFRWFNMGWVAEVELDYKTKQVTYISENDDGEQIRSPPNGIWYIQRDPDTGLHLYVIFFHYKGIVEYSKKHILYQDQPGHMVCRTKHGETPSSKGWTAMWPVG